MLVSARTFIKAMRKAGYIHDRAEESPLFYRAQDERMISVPVHKGRDLGRGLLRSMLRDADISPEDFLK